jgi:hypothetical protein
LKKLGVGTKEEQKQEKQATLNESIEKVSMLLKAAKE